MLRPLNIFTPVGTDRHASAPSAARPGRPFELPDAPAFSHTKECVKLTSRFELLPLARLVIAFRLCESDARSAMQFPQKSLLLFCAEGLSLRGTPVECMSTPLCHTARTLAG